MILEYVHEEMNQEVRAVSGHYMLSKEVRLSFNGREILYIVGHATIDNSCCGVGGFSFALVPGYIISWQGKSNSQGLSISELEPIRDPTNQQEVTRVIQDIEMVTQVQFW